MMESQPPYTDENYLVVSPSLVIPRDELQFRTSRSSGPGGQNVQKVETRVELLFDVANSPSLSEEQRARLREVLAARLDNDGVLHLTSEKSRSQIRNREDTIERFVVLLQHALRPRKTRKPTRVPRAVKEARLDEKRRRSEVKRRREKGNDWD